MNKSLITLLLLLVAFANTNAQNDSIIDKVIAVVGNQIVLKSEVEEQYLQMQARGMVGKENQKCEIFEQLLFQKLLVVQAKIDSIEITEKQVNAEIDGRLKKFIEQIGSPEKLEEYFGKSIREIKEDFKPIVGEQLLAQKMQQEITKDVKITPSEVQVFFNSIPKDSLPILDANYEISQITVQPKISAKTRKELKEKLQKLKDRILKGESFATMAVLYSDDKASARNGGELGFVNRSSLVPEFASAAFDLEPNEISDIVETEYGFHIIQLIERKGEKINVRHILFTPKMSFAEKYQAKQKLDSIAKLIRTDSISFSDAAMKFSDDENTRKNGGLLINPYTGTSKFEIKQIDPETNYALRQLKVGQISEPFEAKSEKGQSIYKIIYLKSKTKPHTVNLKDDYQQIQEMALGNKKEKVVKEWVKNKQKETYIKINGNYKKCHFNFPGWIK